jgi:hypothetical protein
VLGLASYAPLMARLTPSTKPNPKCESCAQVLGLASYPPLMARLAPARRREMALTVVRAVLKGDTKVANSLVTPSWMFRLPIVHAVLKGDTKVDMFPCLSASVRTSGVLSCA